MSKQIVVHNTSELEKYKNTIWDNLNSSTNMLQQVLNNNDALDAPKAGTITWAEAVCLKSREIEF